MCLLKRPDISMKKDCIDKYIREHLSEHRLTHTYGVRDLAVKLADIYGACCDKAEIAALIHDMAKPLDDNEANAQIIKYGLDRSLLNNRNIAHGHIAAAWAKDMFGIDDEDILNAARYHTTARKDMSLLEKIIYVADTVEVNRTYEEASMLREKSLTELDNVYKYILIWTKENLKERNLELSKDTKDAIAEVLNDK